MGEVLFHEPQKLILPGVGITFSGLGALGGLRGRKEGFTKAAQFMVADEFLPLPSAAKDRRHFLGQVSARLIERYDNRKGLDKEVRRRGIAAPQQGGTSVQRTLSTMQPYGSRTISL
ncbi:MAG: hypothetical protein ACRDQZ_15885 [Mycobacteriales bacterium]